MRVWGKEEERGVLWACIAAITIFLLVIPDPDTDLTVVFPGNPPYSWLWYLLNPMYWTKRAYSMIIFAEWVGVTAVEWWLVHKGKLNGNLVKLQKIPLPGTSQWNCAFSGTGTQITYWTNPCLSSSTQWNLLGGHVYALTYFVLILWIVLPLILRFRPFLRFEGRGSNRFKPRGKGESGGKKVLENDPHQKA